MHIVGVIAGLAIVAALATIYAKNQEAIKFFSTGLDSKFSMAEVKLLWKVAHMCELEEPQSLYWSLPSLTRCLARLKSDIDSLPAPNPAMQHLLTKLYAFRTKVERESKDKKGMSSTKRIENDARLRIILPGFGVFSSYVMNNSSELIVAMPTQKGVATVEAGKWEGATVNVYLWRSGDARYVFDTTVIRSGMFLRKPALYLKHTDNLLRTQKRKSIRAACNVHASLYMMESAADMNAAIVETRQGYRCLVEDISEDGALIRIGGKGRPGAKVKIQLELAGRVVVMLGIVRSVEFNEKLKQSRLHFECLRIDPAMRNHVLSYVYNILPQKEKEVYEALSLEEGDETGQGGASDETQDGQPDDGAESFLTEALETDAALARSDE